MVRRARSGLKSGFSRLGEAFRSIICLNEPFIGFKKIGYAWKRFRRVTAGKPTEAEYNQGVQDLQTLMTLSTLKHIDLYFADESGFSRLPQIPYGWLPKRKAKQILSDSKRVMNVFGLMSLDQTLHLSRQRHDHSDFICQALDDFCSTITCLL